MTRELGLEAVFHFSGGGLFIQGEALGRSTELDRDGRRVTITLPGSDDLDRPPPPTSRAGRTLKSGGRWSLDPQTGEFEGVLVDRFEVRVQVTRAGDEPLAALVEEAFPFAAEAAESLLSWMRTRGGQYWLPAPYDGPNFVGYGELVVAGTDEEVDSSVRWDLGYVLQRGSADDAATAQQIEDAFSKIQAGAEPPIEDVLLTDARAVLRERPIVSRLRHGRRDTSRVVLLAAIAAEVKIKRTLLEKAPPEFRNLVNIIVDNPRDVTIATGQLLDKPMKAAVGASLRDSDKGLFVAVTETLFPLRNRIAHHGEQPTLGQAQTAFSAAERLFAWLETL